MHVPNNYTKSIYTSMYHFVWADQREKQGYKCDVSLKRGIQIICTLENDATLYIGRTNPILIVGFNLLIIIIESIHFEFDHYINVSLWDGDY